MLLIEVKILTSTIQKQLKAHPKIMSFLLSFKCPFLRVKEGATERDGMQFNPQHVLITPQLLIYQLY